MTTQYMVDYWVRFNSECVISTIFEWKIHRVKNVVTTYFLKHKLLVFEVLLSRSTKQVENKSMRTAENPILIFSFPSFIIKY